MGRGNSPGPPPSTADVISLFVVYASVFPHLPSQWVLVWVKAVRLSVLLYLESHSPYFVIRVRKAVHGSLLPGTREQQPQCVWRPRGTEMAQAGFQSPVRSTPWPNWVLLSLQHPLPLPPQCREVFQARGRAPSSGAGVMSSQAGVRMPRGQHL